MSKLPKCFISLGTEGNWLNIDCIKTLSYNKHGKAVITDKYNIKYQVDPRLVINLKNEGV